MNLAKKWKYGMGPNENNRLDSVWSDHFGRAQHTMAIEQLKGANVKIPKDETDNVILCILNRFQLSLFGLFWQERTSFWFCRIFKFGQNVWNVWQSKVVEQNISKHNENWFGIFICWNVQYFFQTNLIWFGINFPPNLTQLFSKPNLIWFGKVGQ